MKTPRRSALIRTLQRSLAPLGFAGAVASAIASLANAATAPLSPNFQRSKTIVTQPPVLGEGPSSIFLTLSQDTKTNGPIRHQDGTGDVAYVNSVYHIIETESDQLGSFYLTEENPEAYIAFMAGAIAVPFNESKFQQFRKPIMPKAYCSPQMQTNTGEELARVEGTSGNVQSVVACNAITPDQFPDYTQVMGSYDGQSFGLYQENYREFPAFVDSLDYLDVTKTARDGLGLYLTGFKKVLANVNQYGCIVATPGGPIDWEALARGVWSGPYNSGNALTDKVCRFVPAFDKTPIDVRWQKENDIPFGLNYTDFLDNKNGFLALILTGPQQAEYQAILAAFLRMGKGGTLTHAEAQEAATQIHEMITNPSAAPQGPPTLSAGIVALRATSGEIPADESVRKANISDTDEVATPVTSGFGRDLPRTMYVDKKADLYLSPSAEQALLVGSISTDKFEMKALKRVVTHAADGSVTGHWFEVELPDDEGLAQQIHDRNANRADADSRPPIRPGTSVYVQAAQLDLVAGVIGHFLVTLHSGTLNMHTNYGTSAPIRDWAANHEELEAIDSQRGRAGATWYKIYSPYTNADLWVSGRYLRLEKVQDPR